MRKCADSDHPVHVQSVIRTYYYPGICFPLKHSKVSNDVGEGPDQTARTPEDMFSHNENTPIQIY